MQLTDPRSLMFFHTLHSERGWLLPSPVPLPTSAPTRYDGRCMIARCRPVSLSRLCRSDDSPHLPKKQQQPKKGKKEKKKKKKHS